MRTSRILFNDPPPAQERHFSAGLGAEMFIQGLNTAVSIKESPITRFYSERDSNPDSWKSIRLRLVLFLRLSDCVEYIHQLRLTITDGRLSRIEFDGVRHQVYTNRPPHGIRFDRTL